MSRRDELRVSFVASLLALLLLAVAVAFATLADAPASQEQFETVAEPAQYTARLLAAGGALRAVLFVDCLFMLAYTVAIGFAMLAFADNCRPAAWLGGVGIIAVMLLDGAENTLMAQSLDLAALSGAVEPGRIAAQAAVSALKWQVAAATLLAASFSLPSRTLVERTLVWGTRLGLPVAVPLFLIAPWDLREFAGLLLLVSMAGGFALLALVVRDHARAA